MILRFFLHRCLRIPRIFLHGNCSEKRQQKGKCIKAFFTGQQGGIPHPVAVRYAWANNPEGANLYNREGLPASPFETSE